MPSEPSYCIDGKLEVPRGALPPALTIVEQLRLVADSLFAPAAATIAADGGFRECGLHPGEYRLAARSGPSSNPPHAASVAAFARISITNGDLRDVLLETQLPVSVSGEIAWNPPPGDTAVVSPEVDLSKSLTSGNDVDKPGQPPSIGGMFSYAKRVPEPWTFVIGPILWMITAFA